jgi:hypothetical protein
MNNQNYLSDEEFKAEVTIPKYYFEDLGLNELESYRTESEAIMGYVAPIYEGLSESEKNIYNGLDEFGVSKELSYDDFFEKTIIKYGLSKYSPKYNCVNMTNLLIKWWESNMENFNKYSKAKSVANLICLSRNIIWYHCKKKKESLTYNEDVKLVKKDIEEFEESNKN